MRRSLDEVEYDLAEFSAILDEDEAWRTGSATYGGPLRDSRGRIRAVPAFMRLDYQTDRDGPTCEHRPELGPCWQWRTALTNGYGYVRVGKRKVQAYRVNYERWVGPIPPGAVMDHLCRNRACVHPLHVEPTTYSENTRRSPIHSSAVKAARTECPYGHAFSPSNTRVNPDGSRACRACQATAAQRYRDARSPLRR